MITAASVPLIQAPRKPAPAYTSKLVRVSWKKERALYPKIAGPTLEHATYNCPWEKQSVFRSIPHDSNDCP